MPEKFRLCRAYSIPKGKAAQIYKSRRKAMKKEKSSAMGTPYTFEGRIPLKQAQIMMKNYGYAGMEKIILLLHQYNLKSIGVGDTGTNSASLMKELVVKMILC